MARPVKWARDLHPIRERAQHARTETWSRQDIEHLFSIGRASSQTLMKAIGDVQTVGATHFIDRASLLRFLEEMIAAPSVEAGMQARLLEADAPPKPKPLRVALPADLRSIMLRDLPGNIRLAPGRLEIDAPTAEAMLESLALLAQAMQNDLDQVQTIIEPPQPSRIEDSDLREFLLHLQQGHVAVRS